MRKETIRNTNLLSLWVLAIAVLFTGCSKDLPGLLSPADASLENARAISAAAFYAANTANNVNECGCYDVFADINFAEETGPGIANKVSAILANLSADEAAYLFNPVCSEEGIMRSACAASCEEKAITSCDQIPQEDLWINGASGVNDTWAYPVELAMRNGQVLLINDPGELFDALTEFYRHHNDNDCKGRVKLCGAREVPAVASNGKGKFDYEINDDGTLSYSLWAKHMNSNVLFAHIHVAGCGVNGGVGATLFNPGIAEGVPANGDLIEGELTDADLVGPWAGLTIADLCAAFEAGEAYINVHSVSNPSGELRGQVGDQNCKCDDDDEDEDEEVDCEDEVDLCGEQEVPPVDTDGEGEFEYELEDDGTLKYKLKASGLSSDVLFAHIHVAICGENGPVGATIFNPDSPVPADGELIEGVLTDADLTGPWEGLTIADVCDAFEAGGAYINVHTVDVPSGELRGQIGDPDCECEDDDDDDHNDDEDCEGDVDLCNEREVPPAESDGYGKFDYRLKNDGSLWYKLRVMHLNSNVLFAHIHVAPCGENGPVGATIYNPDTPVRGNGTLIVSTLTDEDLVGPWAGLTIEDLCAAFEAGAAYINVHTEDIPSGELRGQVGDEECECED